MNNKETILKPALRVWLALFGVIVLASVLSAINGKHLYLGNRVDFLLAETGEVIINELYSPAKVFFALIASFIPPILWLLFLNNKPQRPFFSIILPLLLFLSGLLFFFLKPQIIPGEETTAYRYGLSDLNYQTIRWQKMVPGKFIDTHSKFQIFLEYLDLMAGETSDNIKNAYICETERETQFYTLTINQRWLPDKYPHILDAHCSQIKEINSLTESTLSQAHWFLTRD
ncbi:hypothetical protein ABLV17_23245 [Klebsiella sp. CN_Kp091]|uniref:hypothetical protein n=1 Tax=Klebsiella TaxID=570 RepID=UPI00277CC3E8|nr:hypothetical protein [Klebsiella aerogenes]MDQ8583830.1 hypothetical protein [Klebsiella aerogenes]HDS6593504.1 hypothetical protein [Klebsiella aerogenes]